VSEVPDGATDRTPDAPSRPQTRPRTPEVRMPLSWRVNLVLLLTTLATTLLAGAGHEGLPVESLFAAPLAYLAAGVPFAFSLLGIRGAHEMGHYLVARRHGVDVSLPFFIPVPTEVGTFGAVIRMRSPIPSRTALLDIAVAGPLAGFVAAVPVLILGVLMSEAIPLAALEGLGGQYFGEPLIHKLLVLLLRDDPPGTTLLMNAFAFAGWVALLVTFINLIPVGQLDGGHLRYALLGARADRLQRPISVAMLAWGGLGLANWLLWGLLGADGPLTRFLLSWCSPAFFVWGLLLLLVFGRAGWAHPPVQAWAPLTPGRRWLAAAAIVVFVLVFMPSPISVELF